MAENNQSAGNIREEYNLARIGLDMDSSANQIAKGKLSYALNATIENFDSDSVNYQNEPGNELCLNFPQDYHLIGTHFIPEKNKHIFFLTNPSSGASEIGYMNNNDCTYHTLVSATCLNFNIDNPIHKVVHKITNCTTEIYWTDGLNPRRYLDIENIPYILSYPIALGGNINLCGITETKELDCNKLNVQPNFEIPQLEVVDINTGGELQAGTYQFAIQYCDANGNPYTSYYSVTNPTPIFDANKTTLNFNYTVGRSIVINASNLDISGLFKYFNLAVIKTVNAISSVELVGTYFINNVSREITYTGQNVTQIRLTINDIFEKFPYYEIAEDLTTVQDVLVWDGLTSIDRINYQQIANQIDLKWQSYRIPNTETYADELNATNYRGYLRDEVYAFEIVFLLKNGKQTDGFHIPGRAITFNETSEPLVPTTNPDFVGDPEFESGGVGYSAYWKIYNTASVTGFNPEYSAALNKSTYKGPYQYGEFAYWESTEKYPCNIDVWGELADQPIRHHKFPDVLVSPIFESPTYALGPGFSPVIQNDAIFPIGVRIDIQQVSQLIFTSNLTQEQKQSIVAFKIVRGDRSTNKSIISKGILRNVGKYNREGTDYYYPNYPYNDLAKDPFILSKSNAYRDECRVYTGTPSVSGTYQYTDCYTNTPITANMTAGTLITITSLSTPIALTGTVTFTESTTIPLSDYYITPELEGFSSDDSKYRHVFNSPETLFGQPYLGNVLKLENIILGGGKAHFVQVKRHALYKLLTKEAQQDALKSSSDIAFITGTLDPLVLFTAYQAYLQIYVNGITRRNYAYSFNSIASYDYSADIINNVGVKQRPLAVAQYIFEGVQAIGETNGININNYNRESSVFLKTIETRNGNVVTPLPFPDKSPSIAPTGVSLFTDNSRFVSSDDDKCSTPSEERHIDVISYYGSMKNIFVNQWGQIYSYDTIDTGFQRNIEIDNILNGQPSIDTVFGGDTFIGKFAFKTKLPLFIDDRVNAPDDSDIFYDEVGNIAYPKYWFSSRSILSDYTPIGGTVMKNIISIKAHNFDCPNSQLPAPTPGPPVVVNPNRTYYDGKMYLYAYGIPYFYVESSINVDLRQAFNNQEGDFYPHVSTGIPDNWLQESVVPIAQDNTYYYNVTYSKQNKENLFSHLPNNWEPKVCFTTFPFRAIYSDQQESFTNSGVNNWLNYSATSYFDFPQNFGKLTSLDGIQNKAVLARFENKSLLYNTMLTVQTSNPQAAYLGNDTLFKSAPPIDFAETDLGYVGSQNKFLLKIPQGQITVDAKRGQIFLIAGNQASDLAAFGLGMNKFFTDHLAFEILRYYPTVDTDNHFNGIGLHGVYDSKFDRVIISKFDYIPQSSNIKYDEATKDFYVERVVNGVTFKDVVSLSDTNYFCNKSWTLSFNMNTKSWVSFHSYIPNFYIAENNFFYSGINGGCDLEALAFEELPPPPSTINWSLSEADLAGEYFVDGRLYIDYTDVSGNLQTLDVDTPSSGSLAVKENTTFTAWNTSNFRGFNVPVDSSTITITVDGISTNVSGGTITDFSIITATAAPVTTVLSGVYTVAATTSVVVTDLSNCICVGYGGQDTCCEAIAGYNEGCIPDPGCYGSSLTVYSSCGSSFGIGCTVYYDPALEFPVLLFNNKWIYDGTTCWHVGPDTVIDGEGSCTTTTTTTLPTEILTSFNSGTGLNNDAWTVDYDSNNNYVVGGDFTAYNGVTYNRIIRFNSSGVPDPTFTGLTSGFNGTVNVVKIQPDNKILVGGSFTTYNGVSANCIVRLNYDGSIDGTFNYGIGFSGNLTYTTGTTIKDIDVQSDGKILVIGVFSSYDFVTAYGIIRLSSSGAFDSTFITGTGLDRCDSGFIREKSDGTIVIGGYISYYNGSFTRSMCKLSSTGSFINYYVNDGTNSGKPNDIYLNSDDTIISVGTLTPGSPNYYITPIKNNTDYTRNAAFLANVGTGFGVYSIYTNTAFAVDGDSTGKYIIGGGFTLYNGNTTMRVVKINADGTYDSTWSIPVGFNSYVQDLKINEAQNLVYVVGRFTSFDGQTRQRVAVLHLNVAP